LQIFFSSTTTLNALIFGMEHPEDQEIQVCSIEVPGVQNGLTLRVKTFKNLINHLQECNDI